jgi:hypothetical protein
VSCRGHLKSPWWQYDETDNLNRQRLLFIYFAD